MEVLRFVVVVVVVYVIYACSCDLLQRPWSSSCWTHKTRRRELYLFHSPSNVGKMKCVRSQKALAAYCCCIGSWRRTRSFTGFHSLAQSPTGLCVCAYALNVVIFIRINSMANISYHRNQCFMDWGLSSSWWSICSVSAFHDINRWMYLWLMAKEIQCTYTVVYRNRKWFILQWWVFDAHVAWP